MCGRWALSLGRQAYSFESDTEIIILRSLLMRKAVRKTAQNLRLQKNSTEIRQWPMTCFFVATCPMRAVSANAELALMRPKWAEFGR